MSYYATQVAVPQSFITKGKQRLKQFSDIVYLNDGDEFEIELFNPTINKVLAKIELNGNSIGSGIVLRPGERVFLERYLDEAKKFLFETYQIEGNNNQVQQAIMKNGMVSISFYNEVLVRTPFVINSGTGSWGTLTTTTTNIPHTYTTHNTLGNTTLTSGISGLYDGTVTTSNASSYFTNSSVTTDSLTYSTNTLRSQTLGKQTKSVETGRVEKGSSSNQSFTYDSSSFSTYANYTNTWKILPKSQKVLVKEELSVYCTECGSKRKKDSHKFCPHCGTKY